MTLSGATILVQSEPGSNGNEGVLRIPQSSTAGVSPSDCLMSYPKHSLGGSVGVLPFYTRWGGGRSLTLL